MSPQQTIAHYRITAKLGEGGMGEVWRATDTKLGREVAIKVLPAEFATDPDRLARFQREAQVLASLNHPNIAAIYGVETAGGVSVLVMELVEGPTIEERIAQGPIPSADALPIAVQIAEALEAAHERGVVHRDLKPANVKIAPEGRVKVLDFGLAKAPEPAGPGVARARMLARRATSMMKRSVPSTPPLRAAKRAGSSSRPTRTTPTPCPGRRRGGSSSRSTAPAAIPSVRSRSRRAFPPPTTTASRRRRTNHSSRPPS